MNNTPLINDKIDLIYKDLKEICDKLPKEINPSKLKENMMELKRIEQNLKKGFIFVTIQGSLKTGKSSLTNLLVKSKKEVAITRLGQDTTAVPYIISRSKDNKFKMILFKKKGSIKTKGNQIQNLISQIIDYIKGFDLKELWNTDKFNFEKKIIENPSIEDIQKYTVENRDNEILLVNIQVPKEQDSLLDYEAALLDTPGIESTNLNEEIVNLLMKNIENNSNLVIAMQSTVTPINSNELKSLEKYRNTISEENFYFVHNIFEIKPWANKTDKQKLLNREKEAIKNAKDNINNKFKINPYIIEFNIEKVKDYLLSSNEEYKKNNELKKESEKFLDFEKTLIDKIKDQRKQIIENNAKTKFNTIKKNLNNVFEEYKNELKEKINEIEEEKNEILNSFKKARKELRELDDLFINSLKRDKYYNEKIINLSNEYTNIKISDKKNIDITKEKKILLFFDVLDKDYEKIFSKIEDFNKKIIKQINEENKIYIKNKLEEYIKSNNLTEFKELKNKLENYGIFLEMNENIKIPKIDIKFNEKNINNLEINNLKPILNKHITPKTQEASNLLGKIKDKVLGPEVISYEINIKELETDLREEYIIDTDTFFNELKKEIQIIINEFIKLSTYEQKFKEKFEENNKKISFYKNLIEEIITLENKIKDIK